MAETHLFDVSHVVDVTPIVHVPIADPIHVMGSGSEHGASFDVSDNNFHAGGSTDFHGSNTYDAGYTYTDTSTGDYSLDCYTGPSDSGCTGTWSFGW